MLPSARRWTWLFGVAFVACRYGYDELSTDLTSGAASSGAAANAGGDTTAPIGGEPNSGGGSPSTQGAAGPGGEAAGGTTPATGGTPPSAGSGGQMTGTAGQAGGAGQAGSATVGGAPPCATGVALTSNATPSVAPAPTCAYPGALICDDFEGGQKPYWTVVANAPAQASLETCLVHGGSTALWARPTGGIPVQVQEQLSPAVAAGNLFVRTFLYLPSSATLPNWTVLYEVWDSPTNWTNKISIDLQPDGSVTLNNWAGAGKSKTSLTSATAVIPRDQWTCVELEIVVDKVNGATRLYLDDTQVVTSTGNIRTRGTRAFCTVSTGAVPGDAPLDLYQDDLVVATQRVGCQ